MLAKGPQVTDDNNHRRTERTVLRADIDMRRPGDHRYRVNVMDFSPEGCRFESPIVVQPGHEVYVSLPGLETIQGVVRWTKEWMVGVEFTRPLYPAVFEMVRAKMEAMGRE